MVVDLCNIRFAHMNLFRFLLLAAAIYLIVRLIRASRASIGRKSPPQVPRPEQTYEPMGRCARCGTHLPQSALSRAQLCGRCSD